VGVLCGPPYAAPAAASMVGGMHRDTKEILIGFSAMVLFAIALVVWPAFGDAVGSGFYYLSDLAHQLLGIISK
jgi:hypothetical protein